ncbi:uncharacterized protein TrAFT101_007261 [Trichoderma asperellum]|uniref:uncharacterized protein n=1 Tax=Trichoderma asperellum TaxID=101201 RepID=UPI00332A6AE4|nr:hypothetical protein TrAFT101_007261 [Trichoderma asperellum]
MENLAVSTTSIGVSDTWSHKARSGSHPPALQPEQGEAIQSDSPLPTEISRDTNDKSIQNNALRGVGSQFSTINDQVRNKGLHLDL